MTDPTRPAVSNLASVPPRSFWREVPCGHPTDPVAWLTPDGPACHCGRILDAEGGMSIFGAPGPVVPCDGCGCHVAIPPVNPLAGFEIEARDSAFKQSAGITPREGAIWNAAWRAARAFYAPNMDEANALRDSLGLTEEGQTDA